VLRRFFCGSGLLLAAGCGSASRRPIRLGLPPEAAARPHDTAAFPAHVQFLTSARAALLRQFQANEREAILVGAGAYAQLWKQTSGQVQPLIAALDAERKPRYHSMIVVKQDSPYQSVADLRNRVLMFVDPLSTSGYLAPQRHLREEGYGAAFFAETPFAQTHENALQAVVHGNAGAAATWWFSDDNNASRHFANSGRIAAGSLRVIWQSPPLPSPLWVSPPGNRPAADLLLRFAQNHPDRWAATSHESYTPMLYLPEGA
jgi:hypothetical protein